MPNNLNRWSRKYGKRRTAHPGRAAESARSGTGAFGGGEGFAGRIAGWTTGRTRNSGCGLPNRGAILPGWHSSGYKPLEELPEYTSLQRAVKAHLAAGGRLGMARGIPTHKAITENQGAMG